VSTREEPPVEQSADFRAFLSTCSVADLWSPEGKPQQQSSDIAPDLHVYLWVHVLNHQIEALRVGSGITVDTLRQHITCFNNSIGLADAVATLGLKEFCFRSGGGAFCTLVAHVRSVARRDDDDVDTQGPPRPFYPIYPVQKQHQEESGDVYGEIIVCISSRLWTATVLARLGK